MPKAVTRFRHVGRAKRTITEIAVIVAVAILGTHLTFISHAASPATSVEAVAGALTGGATIVSDPSASGGKAVQFRRVVNIVNVPSGEAMPTGNLPGFRQIYSTDFSQYNVPLGSFSNCSATTLSCSGLSSYGGIQNYITDYPDGWPDTEGNNDPSSPGACYYYPSETLSVTGGLLNMFIHTDSDNRCVTAVPEPILPTADQVTPGSNAQLYGEYSVRMRSDAIPGYLAAFLLWPADQNWPHDGEIDFPNSELTGNAGAYMHHEGGTSGGDQDAYSSNTTYANWHTYTIIWTPSYVKFEIDGTVIGDSTVPAEIPNTPMYWVLQTEGDISTSKPSASTKGNLQIAWATIYAYDPSVK